MIQAATAFNECCVKEGRKFQTKAIKKNKAKSGVWQTNSMKNGFGHNLQRIARNDTNQF